MTFFRKLLDSLQEKIVKRNCSKGKHRWTEAQIKDDEGGKQVILFCQSCDAIGDPNGQPN